MEPGTGETSQILDEPLSPLELVSFEPFITRKRKVLPKTSAEAVASAIRAAESTAIVKHSISLRPNAHLQVAIPMTCKYCNRGTTMQCYICKTNPVCSNKACQMAFRLEHECVPKEIERVIYPSIRAIESVRTITNEEKMMVEDFDTMLESISDVDILKLLYETIQSEIKHRYVESRATLPSLANTVMLKLAEVAYLSVKELREKRSASLSTEIAAINREYDTKINDQLSVLKAHNKTDEITKESVRLSIEKKYIKSVRKLASLKAKKVVEDYEEQSGVSVELRDTYKALAASKTPESANKIHQGVLDTISKNVAKELALLIDAYGAYDEEYVMPTGKIAKCVDRLCNYCDIPETTIALGKLTKTFVYTTERFFSTLTLERQIVPFYDRYICIFATQTINKLKHEKALKIAKIVDDAMKAEYPQICALLDKVMDNMLSGARIERAKLSELAKKSDLIDDLQFCLVPPKHGV